MADLGNRVTGNTGVWHQVGSTGGGNQQLLSTFTAAESGFITQLGAWVRSATATTGALQLAVWAIDVNGLPTDLLGYTNQFSASASSTSGGVNWQAPVVWSKATPSVQTANAIPIEAGKRYGFGIQNDVANVQLAVHPSEVARTLMYRTVSAGNPTNPFGTVTTQSNLRLGSIWGVFTPAIGPTVTITGPASLISTSTPTITATVSDPESVAPYRDKMSSYLVEVRKQGQTALWWQPTAFTATEAERNAGQIIRLYAGPDLTTGPYEVRIQASDATGTPGAWSSWYAFTLANQPSIDITTATPTGKQESGAVTTWSGVWTSPSALSMNAAKVRIMSGSQVLRQSIDWQSLTVAPGGAVNLADSAANVKLTQGTNGVLPAGSYTWQMQGRDTSGTVSPWSTPVPFTINYPPNTPTSLRPDSGTRSALRPQISWLVSDNDADDVLGAGLSSDYEVTRLSNGAVVSGTTANVDPLTGRGYLDITTTEMPAAGDYQWRVRGRDLSAVAAGTGLGGWSTSALFTLIVAPTVTITAPTEGATIQTGSPQIAWTVATGTQLFYRVEMFLPGQTAPFWGSGIQPAGNVTLGTHNIPAGVLTNGAAYDVRVTIWGPGDVESTSLKRRFTVSYPTADTVNNVSAGLLLNDSDYEPTTVVVQWAATAYPQLQFAGYVVTRRLDTESSDEAVVIAHLLQAGQTTFTDYHAPPNVGLIYGVSQLRRVGSDVRQSPVTETTITVPMTTPVIASLIAGQGGLLRAPVMMLADEYAEGFDKIETLLDIWGTGGKPMLVRSPSGYGSVPVSIGFLLMTDQYGTIRQKITRWRGIVRSGHPVSLRTETERLFCAINPSANWLSRTDHVGVWKVALDLKEITWNEAVSITT